MKQTIKINLSQRLFDLDADAFDKLQKYLESLKQYFKSTGESADEILQDIEQRIADVLSEKLDSKKEVVTLRDIEDVIGMMGTVEDFVRDGNEEAEATTSDKDEKGEQKQDFNKQHRRLYRDTENNLIGGVAGGLGAYFNMDPVWIRLAFVLLFFFDLFGLLIYIILWAVVPAARTTAQKLQMKGRPVNVENIQNSVKNEFGKVKDKFSRYRSSDSYKRTQKSVSDAFSTLGEVLIVFIKVVLIIAGIGLIVLGISFLGGLFTSHPFHGFYRNWYFPYPEIRERLIILIENFTLFSFALTLTVMIPVIAILIGLIKLIFNVKGHNNTLSAFGWTIWALALVYVIVVFMSRRDLISFHEKYLPRTEIFSDEDKTLYIGFNDETFISDNTDHYQIFGKTIIHDDFSDKFYLKPTISIEYTNFKETYLLIEETYLFPPFESNHYHEVFYGWKMHDSSLLISEFFMIDEKEMWRIPGLHVTIFIPDDQKVEISDQVNGLKRKPVAYLSN